MPPARLTLSLLALIPSRTGPRKLAPMPLLTRVYPRWGVVALTPRSVPPPLRPGAQLTPAGTGFVTVWLVADPPELLELAGPCWPGNVVDGPALFVVVVTWPPGTADGASAEVLALEELMATSESTRAPAPTTSPGVSAPSTDGLRRPITTPPHRGGAVEGRAGAFGGPTGRPAHRATGRPEEARAFAAAI